MAYWLENKRLVGIQSQQAGLLVAWKHLGDLMRGLAIAAATFALGLGMATADPAPAMNDQTATASAAPAAGAAPAVVGGQPAPAAAPTPSPDDMVICVKIPPPVGSRLGGGKDCRTKAEWARFENRAGDQSKRLLNDQKMDQLREPPRGN